MSTDSTTDPHKFDLVDLSDDAPNEKRGEQYHDVTRPSLYENPVPKDVGKPGAHDLIVESLFDLDGRALRPVQADRKKLLRLVMRDLEDRAELGLNRYGQTLQAGNGRDSLIDLYQEQIDALAYAKVLLDEAKDSTTESEIKKLYDAQLVTVLQTRRVLAIRNGEPIGVTEPAAPTSGS